MKRSILYTTMLVLTACFAACSDDLATSPLDSGEEGQCICLSATFLGYDTDEAVTRAGELGPDFYFKAGDAIGLYAIVGQEITYRNVKATYDGSNWSIASAIAHKKGQLYFAYYPYDANLSNDIQSLSDIVTGWSIPNDQSTEGTFESTQMLLGADPVSTATGTKVSLCFRPQLSMIKVVLPQEKTLYGGIQVGDTEYKPLKSTGENQSNVYGIITCPQGSISLSCQYAYNGLLYNLHKSDVTLKSGFIHLIDKESRAKVPESFAVDLGLPSGTLWAPFFVGAETEGMTEADISAASNRAGSYFAWGEIAPKSNYTQATYFDPSYTQYGCNSNIIGTERDAAHMIWGGNWVMPTPEQLQELLDYCTITKSGNIFTFTRNSKDNSSGNTSTLTFYVNNFQNGTAVSNKSWSTVLAGVSSPKYKEHNQYLRINTTKSEVVTYTGSRFTGMGVRPVLPATARNLDVKSYVTGTTGVVDLGEAGKWAAMNVGAECDIPSHLIPSAADLVDYGKSTLGWRTAWGDIQNKGNYGFGKTGDNPNFDWINVTSANKHYTYFDVTEISGKAAYDLARAVWGSDWRIPTADEWQTLFNQAEMSYTMVNGAPAFKLAVGGNSIYLRANGYVVNQIYYSQAGQYATQEAFYITGNQGTTTYTEGNYVEVIDSPTEQQVAHIYLEGTTVKAEVITGGSSCCAKSNGLMIRAIRGQ